MVAQTGPSSHKVGEFSVSLEPFGPSPEALARIGATIIKQQNVADLLRNTRYRVLSVEAIEPDAGAKKLETPSKPDKFLATIYDYSNSRVLLVNGMLDNGNVAAIEESAFQPPVSWEEYQEALGHVQRHPEFAKHIQSSRYVVYPPMPPVADIQDETGRTRRIVNVGVFDAERHVKIETIGVDLLDGALHHFGERAPAGGNPPNASICGAPTDANQQTTNKGVAGQVWVTVKQGAKTLWRFLAVRPSASSGLRGSGVELRFVDYRGKRVLYRAHVPILNVRYDADKCGPFRDWQWQEGEIQANGADVAPGFRLASSPATTILDTGSDVGNFLGVAIYVQGSEVVLVSEMQAGWYRYVSEWRLASNGTIHPRFGFAATDSPCVCNIHHHHAYWRLDFDIGTAGGNRVREFNDPPIVVGKNWHEKHFEIARPRDPAHKRKWIVENVAGGFGYEIRPRPTDGVATQSPDWPFGRGDIWVLRYHGNEIDDGFNVTTSPNADAKIGSWVNGENVLGQDVVIWYGGHFTHDISKDGPATHGHLLGPDLVPVSWPT